MWVSTLIKFKKKPEVYNSPIRVNVMVTLIQILVNRSFRRLQDLAILCKHTGEGSCEGTTSRSHLGTEFRA